MNDNDLSYFKKILMNQLDALKRRDQNTIHEICSREHDFSDLCDMANLETDHNFFIRIRGREKRLVKKIEEALERIEDGSFGICITCGEDIPIERLKARPVAMRCIHCKEQSEKLKKAVGL